MVKIIVRLNVRVVVGLRVKLIVRLTGELMDPLGTPYQLFS